VLKKFKSLLLRKSSDFIGIDIGSRAIKLVEIAWEKEQPVLKSFGIKEFPLSVPTSSQLIDHQVLTDTLSQLLSTTHTYSKNAVVAVGGEAMFARELVFPAMISEELKEAIKWDLEKYIPYAPDSYYYDFSIIGAGNSDSEIKVLLVASPKEIVNNLISVIKNVGLRLVAVDTEPLALYRIFTDAENAMIVDIGTFLSQVTVFQNGSPAVIRNISIGGQRFTEAIMQGMGIEWKEAEQLKQNQRIMSQSNVLFEDVNVQQQLNLLVSEFARDIRRTTEYYQLQNKDVTIDKVFITGGGANLGNLAQLLAAQLDLPTVIHNPLTKLSIPASFDKKHLEQLAPQLGTAVGLALRGGE
jgi:type IV pilus assembly protein PilM